MKEAKRYKGICPTCGKEMWICMSIAMKLGINTGCGRCPECNTFLHMTFNQEHQEMDLERFEDYQKRQKTEEESEKRC